MIFGLLVAVLSYSLNAQDGRIERPLFKLNIPKLKFINPENTTQENGVRPDSQNSMLSADMAESMVKAKLSATAHIIVDPLIEDYFGSASEEASISLSFDERPTSEFQSDAILNEMCQDMESATHPGGYIESFGQYPRIAIGPFRHATGDLFKYFGDEEYKLSYPNSFHRFDDYYDKKCGVSQITPQATFKELEGMNAASPTKKIYIWSAGWSGYLLFTNSLFPTRDGSYSGEIDSDRLKNLFSYAVTSSRAKNRLHDSRFTRLFKVEDIIKFPERRVCKCSTSAKRSEVISEIKSGATCTDRDDKKSIICVGNLKIYPATYLPRWYFSPENFDADYITYNSFAFPPRVDIDDKGPADYSVLSRWCQIDPYFPCTEISIGVLGGTETELHFRRYFAQKLCGSNCKNVFNNGSFSRALDPNNRGQNGKLLEAYNREISLFADGQFGFLAIPLEIATLRGINLSRLLPLDIYDDNRNVEKKMVSYDNFLIQDFSLAIPSYSFQDKSLMEFLKIIIDPCSVSTLECIAHERRYYPSTMWTL